MNRRLIHRLCVLAPSWAVKPKSHFLECLTSEWADHSNWKVREQIVSLVLYFHQRASIPSDQNLTRQLINSSRVYFLLRVCVCVCACDTAGGQHVALHQREPIRSVCADPHWACSEKGLPAGTELHRRTTAHGGWERKAGNSAHVQSTPTWRMCHALLSFCTSVARHPLPFSYDLFDLHLFSLLNTFL